MHPVTVVLTAVRHRLESASKTIYPNENNKTLVDLLLYGMKIQTFLSSEIFELPSNV